VLNSNFKYSIVYCKTEFHVLNSEEFSTSSTPSQSWFNTEFNTCWINSTRDSKSTTIIKSVD